MSKSPLTPQEIERALKDGMTTATVREDAKAMVLILRPPNSSRTFQLIARIDEVKEL